MELWSACRMVLFPVQMLYHIVRASVAALLPGRKKDLSREVVLVTGGGRGIGRHLAKEFARQGARKVSRLPAYLLHEGGNRPSEGLKKCVSYTLLITEHVATCNYKLGHTPALLSVAVEW